MNPIKSFYLRPPQNMPVTMRERTSSVFLAFVVLLCMAGAVVIVLAALFGLLDSLGEKIFRALGVL